MMRGAPHAVALAVAALLLALDPVVVSGQDNSPASAPNILAMLERDVQGKMSPFLAGRRGSFYMGGQSLAANNPLTTLWNVRENETLGFMHPYFRDGRARGTGACNAVACDYAVFHVQLRSCAAARAHVVTWSARCWRVCGLQRSSSRTSARPCN